MNLLWQIPSLLLLIGVWLVGMWAAFQYLEGRLNPPRPREVQVLDLEHAELIAKHHWGKSVRVQLVAAEYEGDLHCLSCRRQILPGQWFWETPLVDSGGLSFQTCLSCQPGDAEAITHGA
jgi:hypothetical protein